MLSDSVWLLCDFCWCTDDFMWVWSLYGTLLSRAHMQTGHFDIKDFCAQQVMWWLTLKELLIVDQLSTSGGGNLLRFCLVSCVIELIRAWSCAQSEPFDCAMLYTFKINWNFTIIYLNVASRTNFFYGRFSARTLQQLSQSWKFKK